MLHREGFATLTISLLVLGLLNFLAIKFLPILQPWLALLSIVLYGVILQFFRNPTRIVPKTDANALYAPADGQVVVLEETQEDEYFQGKRLMLSIFMSPFNVHANRVPIDGKVLYAKYHPGKYLVAWHPKSSTENERTSIVIDSGKGPILLRQVAGALARRIVYYLKEGQQVVQGEELGFIKFGSRVDIYLPLDAVVKVQIGQKVRGNLDVIAELP
jgi:phosphatidylserine decarboxylase